MNQNENTPPQDSENRGFINAQAVESTQNVTPSPTPPKQKEALKTHLNARKKVIDPSKPLKKAKYEIMARELVKGSSQVDAYKKAYPKCNENTARTNAYQVVAREGIQQRALHLLEAAGLSEAKLASSLNECVESSDERIKLDSTKFGLGMIGYGKESVNNDNKSYLPVQINFIVKPNNSQPIDIKEFTPNDD